MTAIHFGTLHGGQVHAVSTSLVDAVSLCLTCLPVVPLLPREAAVLEH